MHRGAICDLKYFAGKANELHLLRDRVAELEELLGMGAVINADIAALGFSPNEAAVLGILLKRDGCVSRSCIWTAMYGSSHDCEQPEEKLIDVWICKVRKKLSDLGVEKPIKNVWGHGWLITDENKARVKALIARRGSAK